MMQYVIGFGIILLFIFTLIGKKLDDKQAEWHAEEKRGDRQFQIKKRMEEKNYTFERVNSVEGIIRVDGKSYPTFNSGSLTIGGEKRNVTIEINCNLDGCFIEDMYICDFSTKVEIPRGLTYDEEVQQMFSLVAQAREEGIITRRLVETVKKTVNDILYFNELLQEGKIDSLPTKADFVWMG